MHGEGLFTLVVCSASKLSLANSEIFCPAPGAIPVAALVSIANSLVNFLSPITVSDAPRPYVVQFSHCFDVRKEKEKGFHT